MKFFDYGEFGKGTKLQLNKKRGNMTVVPEAEKYKFSPRRWSLPGYHFLDAIDPKVELG
jgi:hypothetical protein